MVHRNAPLSETGRLRLARCVVEDGWPLRRAAERFQVWPTTAARWAARYRKEGAAGMGDRSCRPHASPGRTPARTERRIIGLRVSRRLGPARIAFRLGLNPSTVHKVLARYGCRARNWLLAYASLYRVSRWTSHRYTSWQLTRSHPGALGPADQVGGGELGRRLNAGPHRLGYPASSPGMPGAPAAMAARTSPGVTSVAAAMRATSSPSDWIGGVTAPGVIQMCGGQRSSPTPLCHN